MNNVFSSKSFMARFGAPMSTGPAKATKEVTETFDKNGDGTPFQKEDLAMLRQQAPAKTKRKKDKLKKTAKQLADPEIGIKDFSRKLTKYRKTKKQIKSKSDGPAKKTRAERQADRDSKKTKRRGDRADKRVKRNEAKITKLNAKIKDGKEIFNVDEAGNKTTGRKANRIKKAKDKVEDNKKISQKSKDQKKEKEIKSDGPAKSSGPANKVKKVVRKTLKSQKLKSEAQEIEGQHGYGSNKKSERKNKRADRKREKVKKIYTSLSDKDKQSANEEYNKRRAK